MPKKVRKRRRTTSRESHREGRIVYTVSIAEDSSAPSVGEWAGRDSNPHSAYAEADFKSAASADFATGPGGLYQRTAGLKR